MNIKKKQILVKYSPVVRKFIEWCLLLAIFGFFLSTFLIQSFVVISGSMEETLRIGDFILVEKTPCIYPANTLDNFVFPHKKIRRGMVVVIKNTDLQNKNYIKRIIGLPGERIKIINKKVYINNQLLDEPYAIFRDQNVSLKSKRDNLPEIRIPTARFFCMGDNRDNSFDSRMWGTVPLKNIIGTLAVIFWSRYPSQYDRYFKRIE